MRTSASARRRKAPEAPAADVIIFIDGSTAARLCLNGDLHASTDPEKFKATKAQVWRLLKAMEALRL